MQIFFSRMKFGPTEKVFRIHEDVLLRGGILVMMFHYVYYTFRILAKILIIFSEYIALYRHTCSLFCLQGNHGANLLRHFFSQHRAKHDEIMKINLENKENMPEQPSRNFISVMDCCTNLVTIHGRPFSIIEDEAFKELLKLIPTISQKDQQAINVKNVKENIQAKAHEVRLQISKELKNCLLALKVDVASVKLRRFLGLNIQYISSKLP